MKRFLKICLPICLVLALLIGIARLGFMPRGTPLDYFSPELAFIREWQTKLESCKTHESATLILQDNKEGGKVIFLSDGTWIAVVMEHACCTGAGFNATLYVTSEGDTYLDSDTCYCGFMPLAEELMTHDKKSIDSFFVSIRSSGKHITKF